jgi:hypothetical protein
MVRNRPPGKLARISLVDMPRKTDPSRNAPTKARAPMLRGSTVASRNITARTMMDRTGADIVVPPDQGFECDVDYWLTGLAS